MSKPQLTWIGPSKRWRKRYKGKSYYFPFGTCKTDKEGYRKALAAWERKKFEIDQERHQLNQERFTVELHAVPTDVDCTGLTQAETIDAIAHLAALQIKPPPPLTIKTSNPTTAYQQLQTPPDKLTVKEARERFLANRKERVSLGRYKSIQRNLALYSKALGENQPLDNVVNAQSLTSYNDVLRSRIKQGKLVDITGRDAWATAKQFLRWCYQNEYLDRLPRNFDSRDFTIEVQLKPIELYPLDVLKFVFNSSSERMKLYLILMMNCGFTQKDISDLTPTDIDWERGTITRKRSKTKHHESTPTVTYRLWRETLDLLHKHAKKRGIKVNDNGRQVLRLFAYHSKTRKEYLPLLRADETSNIDALGNDYNNMARRIKRRLPPFKLLRKTSGTMVERFAHCGAYFLGHSPKGMADRHYIQPDQAALDQALEQLREYYLPAITPTTK